MLISFARTRSPPAEQPEILADGFVLALLICMLICFYRPEPGTGSQWTLASSSSEITAAILWSGG